MGQKHTIGELHQMQSLSLQSKIAMTRARIKGWVAEYGEDGVYVSFSGGKDSTVLLHIARDIYPDMKAVFVDTGLEYPEIKQFVKSFDNVDTVKPKMTFRQVLDKYGYPFISKEVCECVYGAKRYLSGGGVYEQSFRRLFGLGEYEKSESGADNKYRKLHGIGECAKGCTVESKGNLRETRERHEADDGEYP